MKSDYILQFYTRTYMMIQDTYTFQEHAMRFHFGVIVTNTTTIIFIFGEMSKFDFLLKFGAIL